jgi:hypothetical protein
VSCREEWDDAESSGKPAHKKECILGLKTYSKWHSVAWVTWNSAISREVKLVPTGTRKMPASENIKGNLISNFESV